MWQRIKDLSREDRAQDLIEYTLLIGFLTLSAVGIFIGSGNSVRGIWASASTSIAAANSTAANPASHGHGDGGQGGGDHGDGDHGGPGRN